MSLVGGLSDAINNSGLTSPGGVAGNVLTGGAYGAANIATGGKLGSQLSSYDPTNPSRQNADYGAANNANSQENAANQGVINGLGASGSAFTGSMTNATNTYDTNINNSVSGGVQGLKQIGQQTNANLGTLSNEALTNAAGAETLQQLQNPNTNPWAQNVQTAYNNQAQGIQNQGLASYGTLAALGSQATAQELGGAGLPITGGQLEALQNSNLSQAGNEFANAQSQANLLRQSGLQASINQANTAYGFGQQANQTAESDVTNQGQFASQNQNDITNLQNVGTQDVYNANSGLASAIYGTQVGQANAQLGQNDNYYGSTESLATGQAGATQASQSATLGAITGVAGSAAGGAAKGATSGLPAAVAAAGLVDPSSTSSGVDTPTTQGAPYSVNPTPPSTNVASTAPYGGVQGGYSAYNNGGGGYNPGASLAQNPYNYNPYDQVA